MPTQPENHGADGANTGQEMTIRFSQVDAAGIVFYPRYFEMIFRAFTTAVIPAPPFGMHMEFRRPNRLGDRLTLMHAQGHNAEDWSICGSLEGVEHFRVEGAAIREKTECGKEATRSTFRTAPEAVQDWISDGRGRLLLSRYFERLSDAIEEWFECRLGVPFHHLHVDDGTGIPTVSFRTDCRTLPAIGDVVRFAIRPQRIGTRSLQLTSWLERNDDWLIRNDQVIVFVKMQSGSLRSQSIPADIRAPLKADLDRQTAPGKVNRVAT